MRVPAPSEATGSASRTVPVTWSPRLLAPRTATSTTPRPSSRPSGDLGGGDRAGEDHGVARVVGGAQADGHRLDDGAGAGPVGDVAADEAVGGEDVHEDVLRAALDGQRRVVVDVLVVARGDGGGHDEGAGRGGWRARGARRPRRRPRSAACRRGPALTGAAPGPAAAGGSRVGQQPRPAGPAGRSGPASMSSICLPQRK